MSKKQLYDKNSNNTRKAEYLYLPDVYLASSPPCSEPKTLVAYFQKYQ
jgi:hypothetical protein